MSIFVPMEKRNKNDCLYFNSSKKIAQMAKVISEQSMRREEFFLEKETVYENYEKAIGDVFSEYEEKITSYNNEINDLFQKVNAKLQESVYAEYDKIMEDFNSVFGRLAEETENAYQNASVDIVELKVFLNKFANENTSQIETLSKNYEETLREKENEIAKKYQAEKAKKDREYELKCKTVVEKEEVDGYAILKQYESIVDELKTKFYSKAKEDPRLKTILKNVRDCLMVLKEGVRHAQRRLLKLQSVSGSNITSFIQRRKVLIDEYKKEFETYKEKCDKNMNEDTEEEMMFRINIEDMKRSREEKKSEYKNTCNKLKMSLESMKKANEIELKSYKDDSSKETQVDSALVEMVDHFRSEERDLMKAAELSRVARAKKVEEAEEALNKVKKKNEEVMEKLHSIQDEDHENYSIEIEATSMQYQRDTDELAAQNKIIEGIAAQDLPEFRKRVERYNELTKEKEELMKIKSELTVSIKKNVFVTDMNTFNEIIMEERKENEAKEKEAKQKSEYEIVTLEDKFISEYNSRVVELNTLRQSELAHIRNAYAMMTDNTEQKEMEKYELLKKQLDSISIPIIDESEQKAQLKMLQAKRKDIDSTIDNQKKAYIEEMRMAQVAEDERFQKALIELVQDSHDDSQQEALKEAAAKKMNMLEMEVYALNKRLLSIRQDKLSYDIQETDESDEVKEIRFNLSAARRESKKVIEDKEQSINEQREMDRKEFEGKKREIEFVTIQKEQHYNNLEAKDKQELENFSETIEKKRYLLEKKFELAASQHEINMETSAKNFETQKAMLEKGAEDVQNAIKVNKKANEKELKDVIEKIKGSIKDAEDHYDKQCTTMNEKKAVFIEQYDKAIAQRREKLAEIKEAYENRPFMPKEQKKFDELTSKKDYLDRTYDFESRTLKRYNVIGMNQEYTFNNRFGNTLTLDIKKFPERLVKTSVAQTRHSANAALPPLH